MARSLPSTQEALRILGAKRTRPAGRPPAPAARALTKTLKALDDKFGHGVNGLKARWPEIVGANLAKRTEPNKLIKPREGGASLEVRVAGPSAALIQHQAEDILSRVNLFLGAGAVARLRIVQGPLRGPERGSAFLPRRRPKPPLDAAVELSLEKSLEHFPEGPLRAALKRLGREVLRGEEG